MFQMKTKKFLSVALAAMMSLSILGTTGLAAASPANPPHPGWDNQVEEPQRPTPPPPKKKHHKENNNTHSQGEVITASLVGAAIGALVAKNT